MHCPSCNIEIVRNADKFFMHHRGICEREYHEQVAIREGYKAPPPETFEEWAARQREMIKQRLSTPKRL